MRQVYDTLGYGMTDEAEVRLRSWHEANPRGKHGSHEYTAEEYGLTTTMIQDRFADYLDHYDVPRGL